MEYIKLDNNIVAKAQVVHMNRNSVVLELQPFEQIFCTRKVFNMIKNNPGIPMYSVKREYQGTTNEWIAVPLTL